MNARVHPPTRRGACPGLSAPMPTGDGLLARLIPSGETIALSAFAGLCAAARRHGNGVIEVTSRGSIQVRGLSAASAGPFAAEVAALGIPGQEGIPVLPDPLSGLLEGEIVDAGAIAGELRQALAAASLAPRLSAKVSVVVDSGGAPHLDDVVADIRLRAVRTAHGVRFHVALGGTAVSAVAIGTVPADRAAECTVRLLERLAAFPPQRMSAAVASAGAARFASVLAGLLDQSLVPIARPPAGPVGIRLVRSVAIAGVGLPFGHSDAETLPRLIGGAEIAGANGLRTAPGRALLFIGMPAGAASTFASHATSLGFITDPADPRRRVIACAGAPVCASGQIPARALAPRVAHVTAKMTGPIHVSGCAKGCAHPAPAPLAIVGRAGACDIQLHGKPVSSAAADALPSELERLLSDGASR